MNRVEVQGRTQGAGEFDHSYYVEVFVVASTSWAHGCIDLRCLLISRVPHQVCSIVKRSQTVCIARSVPVSDVRTRTEMCRALGVWFHCSCNRAVSYNGTEGRGTGANEKNQCKSWINGISNSQ